MNRVRPMSFKVTVCGSSGGYAGAGKACSGFLLESETSTMMLDIGAAALPNMLQYIEADELDALAISHMHYDHYGDIYGLCTARRFWENELPVLPVLATADAKKIIGSPLSESSRPEFFKCLEITTPREGEEIDLAGFAVVARAAAHGIDGFIFQVSCEERTICYSGDTERCDALLELASGADLFICESTFTSEIHDKLKGHMFAREAGRIAAEAEVGSLLLTHLWPTLDGERAVEDAAEEFGGPIDLAEEGLTVFVGPYPCAI
jgi:ribonuclease BN (tRNA processing enzyme)